MLKKIHQITLKDVILLDATKSANSLKKFWFIPVWLCRKELEKLTGEIFKLIGSGESFNVQDELDKLLAYRKLQMLEALYKAVIIEMYLKSKITAYKILFNRDTKESDQFEEVVNEVLKATGIKLDTPESITELRQYIEHKADKYKEMFPEPQPDEEKQTVSLEKVIYSVFHYMKEPYNPDMPLTMFCSMKAMAEDQIRSQSNTQEDGEQ